MSTSVLKSKSKDKKPGKEQKTPIKSSVVVNGNSGIPASAYNPLLGTFHALDTSSTSTPQVVHGNSRFRNIDDSEDHNTVHISGGAEFDSGSNDTRSVESEEQNKEKSNAPNKQEVVPGSDNDKREKIRQKNERKHQRQKEKRAQELQEKCTGYLMSRKLESLAQQLISMGFSQERATMALILNEGRVEEAVAWLFEAGEDSDKHKDQNVDCGSNIKIDISEELSRIAEMEKKFKCSKQEVERAIVTCEGDLEKSEEMLRSQKQDQPAVSPKSEDDLPSLSHLKISSPANQSNIRLLQPKPNPMSSLPQRRDDKDFNYTKGGVTVGLTPKLVPKTTQNVTRVSPNPDWARPQQIARPVGIGSSPSGSFTVASPLQISPPQPKLDSRFVSVGNEFKNHQPGSVREPVVMIQRPQSVNSKKPSPVTRISSSPPGSALNWYPSSSGAMKSNGFRSPSPTNLTSNQFHLPTTQYQNQNQAFLRASNPMDNNFGPNLVNGQSLRSAPSPTLAPASSLGLFSGFSSAFSPDLSSAVDWNTKTSMPSCDYNCIDWSTDHKTYMPTNHNSMWNGLTSPYSRSNGHMNDSGGNLGSRPSSSSAGMGLQDGGGVSGDSTGSNSRDWTSPFEGKDLFSLPRQFVFSPSLL